MTIIKTNFAYRSARRPVVPENSTRGDFAQWGRISASSTAMLAILHLLGTFVLNLFKSRRRLEVENLFLRHQLNCLEGCIATAFTAEK
jgi:hypothetical protein